MTERFARRQPHLTAACLLLAAVFVLFAIRAWHGLHFDTFGDETLHILGAQASQAGGILYRDFIELHGPLAYALPTLFGSLFGWAEPLHVRILPIALTLAAGAAVYGCNALCGAWERITAASLFLGLVATIWLVQGLYLADYQPEAGAFLLIGFAQFTLPALYAAEIAPASLFIAGLSVALTPFVAFSYGPAAVLFALSGASAVWHSGTLRPLRLFCIGALAGTAATLAWMAYHVDFRGYAAFHFMESLIDFRPYQSIERANPLTILWQPLHPYNVVEAMGTAAFVTAAMIVGVGRVVARTERQVPVTAFVFAMAGLILTNPRGSPIFQNAAFMITAFGFFAIMAVRAARAAGLSQAAWARTIWTGAAALVVAGAEFGAREAVTTPGHYTRAQLPGLPAASLAQSDAPWARQVRMVTDPSERMLAVPYAPDLYLLAGRAPMLGFVFYLPWDADYARHPWFGVQHDLCAALKRNPPPVIYDNGWVVWNLYDPARYIACLRPILATQYTPMPGAPSFYVRTDRMARLSRLAAP
jgi:hypothetical protein